MQSARVIGKDIILDIVENMAAYKEELLYSSVVPTSFDVHLHPDDYDRLEGIFPAIEAEARRALDEELARQNRRLRPKWLRKLTGPSAPTKPAHESWTILFFRDENDELQPGDILVDSRLTVPQPPELGAGTRTRRITTSRIGQAVNTRTEIVEIPRPPSAARPTAPPIPEPLRAIPDTPRAAVPQAAAAPDEPNDGTERTVPAVFATLTYEDKAGRHTHSVTAPQVVIGRGGAGYWVDLRVDAAQDVSREHVRLRRDMATGQFFLKDVSLYGTTVNGQRVASSISSSNGTKTDINVEVPLPPVARIGLADVVFLEFRAAQRS
jgi:pSer/pThr/pTyr-binding forkhead associated (FHA) protein